MTKSEKYTAALREIDIRLSKGGDLYADLGNVTAVLKKRFPYIFWIGFYLLQENRLVLGPFQGTPACVFLEMGKGVCGTCANEQKAILVSDVHEFDGHVACDPNSKSELVIPCFDSDDRLRAVLDADSDQLNAFDGTDQTGLMNVADKIRGLWS
ncbi:GAF domain-containing protein [bacterium]|nr:GAF domain-containing protein [bacterium]